MTADNPAVEAVAEALWHVVFTEPWSSATDEQRTETVAVAEAAVAAAWPVFRETAAAAVSAMILRHSAYRIGDAVLATIRSLPAPTTDRTDGGEGS